MSKLTKCMIEIESQPVFSLLFLGPNGCRFCVGVEHVYTGIFDLELLFLQLSVALDKMSFCQNSLLLFSTLVKMLHVVFVLC